MDLCGFLLKIYDLWHISCCFRCFSQDISIVQKLLGLGIEQESFANIMNEDGLPLSLPLIIRRIENYLPKWEFARYLVNQ